jgi:hypothetical protein
MKGKLSAENVTRYWIYQVYPLLLQLELGEVPVHSMKPYEEVEI